MAGMVEKGLEVERLIEEYVLTKSAKSLTI